MFIGKVLFRLSNIFFTDVLQTKVALNDLKASLQAPPAEETFKWIHQPRAECRQGITCMDGTLLTNQPRYRGLAAHSGWAAAASSKTDALLADAHGTPPPWTTGIHAAEL